MQKFLGITVVGLSLLATALVHAFTPKSDPLQQIAGYKQWTRVSVRDAKLMRVDPFLIGG